MSKFRGVYGLFGSMILGAAALPAIAQTTGQISTQEAVVNGDNNQVIQIINQVDIRGGGRGRNTSTTTQDALQGISIDGSGNVVLQESNQVNEASNPRRNSGQRGRSGEGPEFDDDDDDDQPGRRRGQRDDDDRGRRYDDDDDDDKRQGRRDNDDDDD